MATTTSMLALIVCLVTGSVAQKLIVTHAPSYISVQQQSQPLPASDVPNVITDTLGLSDSPKCAWSGLKSGSLFKRPKASVLLTVVTAETSKHDISPQKMAAFPVDADQHLLDMTPVMNSIQSNFLEHQPIMLELMADSSSFDINTPNDVFQKLPSTLKSVADRLKEEDSVLSHVKSGSLNHSSAPDHTLMAELQMIHHVLNTLKEEGSLISGKTPDLFSFAITGLKSVSDTHGPDSEQNKDAHEMVSQFINMVTEEFKKLYKDNVVVQVLAVPAPEKALVRKSRSLMQNTPTTQAPVTTKDLNLAWNYHQDFPAMFNIILWLSVLLSVTVFVIAYGMWNIDPGRDSIIYRMTSQRLKKD